MSRLLCLSNGHGEDAIAIRILRQLKRLEPQVELTALPLVGRGEAYESLSVPIIGAVRQMPSGGFIYMDGAQLWQDLRGGLLGLTLAQLRVVRRWSRKGGTILAVGDIVPLVFAWLSGMPYAFVGTAKSDYYWRDEAGWLPQTSPWERSMGSVYLPWERWLMGRRRCLGVFPRDTLTAQGLGSLPRVFDVGNPMMDDIVAESPIREEDEDTRALRIVLLPGSRPGEATRNWQLILEAVASLIGVFPRRSLVFLAAIAPSLDRASFCQILATMGWQPQPDLNCVVEAPDGLKFGYEKASLLLTQQAYHSCLLAADVGIALAGTATEQLVGLGKPAIATPGKGAQYTPAFAEAQTRLLGPSLTLVPQPEAVGVALRDLLTDADRFQLAAENGRRRMGEAGAALRIASHLQSMLRGTRQGMVKRLRA